MSTALSHLATIRRALGVSQAEVARRAGFAQQYVSLLERGLPPTEETHTVRLAAALKVQPEALRAECLNIEVHAASSRVAVTLR